MIINSIKNNLNTALYSTVDFTRSKTEKIVKFIFESSSVLLHCIGDNAKSILALSAITILVGGRAKNLPLVIVGGALMALTAVAMGIKASTNNIPHLQEMIEKLKTENERETNFYNQTVSSGEYTEEFLSEYHEYCESVLKRNNSQIADYEREITRLKNFSQSWDFSK